MTIHIGPRTISAIGGSIKRVGNYKIHTFPSELVTDGLVLNLDAGDPRSYPGSGTVWTNMSGGGHNATLINGATYNNENGGSIVLDGGTQYASIPGTSSSPWAFGQNGTIEQWVYVNGNTGTNNRFWCVVNNSSSLDAYLNASTYNIGLHGGSVITSTTIPQGVWTHLVVTYTSGTIKVYFNGIEQGLTGTTTGYNSTITSELSVGDFYGHGQNYELNGRISAMRIYNRGLSAAEVVQNYDALKVRYISYTNTFTPLCGGGSGKVEVLCVAGGGGGASGGGGAGGLLYNSAFTVNSNAGIGLTIGAGGTSGNCDQGSGSAAVSGQNSSFGSLISIGGGNGGQAGPLNGPQTGGNGGSGGGAAANGGASNNGGTGTSGQGYNGGGNGGYTSSPFGVGGGGGSAGAAITATSARAFPGGNGLTFAISGTSSSYAGGGGGGAYTGSLFGAGGTGGGGNGASGGSVGTSAIPNTGSGGGGGSNNKIGGNGSNGIVIVRYPATDYNVELLIVGGGGSGGFYHGGGGGAGGLIYYSSYPVSAGTKYLVTVGGGSISQTSWIVPRSGQNSIFGQLIAFGGGDGGNYSNRAGASGGSGGGGFFSNANSEYVPTTGGAGVLGQGNAGGDALIVTGYQGSGGGGAGSSGSVSPSGSVGGAGGAGLAFSITGTSQFYAGGGGGQGNTSGGVGGIGGGGSGAGGTGAGVAGTVNTGGGGGGGGGASGAGGAGGSGIVIIAYQGPQRGIGGTVDTTSRPGYTLHRFTTTGTDFFIP